METSTAPKQSRTPSPPPLSAPMTQHTIVALVQDRPGVLNRVASVFRRRQINIESITATKVNEPGVSQMVLVIETDNIAAVLAQLEKLIDVFEVQLGDQLPSAAASRSPQHTAHNTTSVTWTQADGII